MSGRVDTHLSPTHHQMLARTTLTHLDQWLIGLIEQRLL